MAFDDHHYKWIIKESLGSARIKNEKDVLKIVAGYTSYALMPSAASTTAVHAAIAASGSGATTVTSGFTNPDVPRVLTVTGATSAAGNVVVTGTNIEGKVISDNFLLNGTSTITGLLAFKTVTKVVIPTQTGTMNITIGTSNTLGLRHRLEPGQYTIRVVLDTTSAATSLDNQTFDSQPTVTSNATLLEANTFLPITTPDSAHWFRTYYCVFSWSLNNQEGQEQYYTTTSTSSTSSSTSTTTITTSTSISSTSVSSTSISSTSTSVSSTSISTSSSISSTSTSTLP